MLLPLWGVSLRLLYTKKNNSGLLPAMGRVCLTCRRFDCKIRFIINMSADAGSRADFPHKCVAVKSGYHLRFFHKTLRTPRLMGTFMEQERMALAAVFVLLHKL